MIPSKIDFCQDIGDGSLILDNVFISCDWIFVIVGSDMEDGGDKMLIYPGDSEEHLIVNLPMGDTRTRPKVGGEYKQVKKTKDG